MTIDSSHRRRELVVFQQLEWLVKYMFKLNKQSKQLCCCFFDFFYRLYKLILHWHRTLKRSLEILDPLALMWQSGSDCSLSVFTCVRLIWMYSQTQSSAGSIHIWYILLQTNKHKTNKHMHTLSRTHINHMPHGCHSPVMFPVCVCVCVRTLWSPATASLPLRYFPAFSAAIWRIWKRSRFAYLLCKTWLSKRASLITPCHCPAVSQSFLIGILKASR